MFFPPPLPLPPPAKLALNSRLPHRLRQQKASEMGKHGPDGMPSLPISHTAIWAFLGPPCPCKIGTPCSSLPCLIVLRFPLQNPPPQVMILKSQEQAFTAQAQRPTSAVAAFTCMALHRLPSLPLLLLLPDADACDLAGAFSWC